LGDGAVHVSRYSSNGTAELRNAAARAAEAAKRAEAERKAIAKEAVADFEVSDIEQIPSDCGRSILG
jgi:hypothetical protein